MSGGAPQGPYGQQPNQPPAGPQMTPPAGPQMTPPQGYGQPQPASSWSQAAAMGNPGQAAPMGQAPKKSNGTMIIVIVGVVVLALIAAAIGATMWMARPKSTEAVENYYKEAKSLGYSDLNKVVVDPPAVKDITFAKSARPKGDVRLIKAVDAGNNQVETTFEDDLGQRTVKIPVKKDGGKYKVVGGVGKVTVNAPEGFEFQLGYGSELSNGKEVSLFPGVYEIKPRTLGEMRRDSSAYAVKNDASFSIAPGESKTINVELAITDQGRQRLAQRATSALSMCTLSTADKANCPAMPTQQSLNMVGDMFRLSMPDNRSDIKATVDDGQPLTETCAKLSMNLQASVYPPNQFQRVTQSVPFTATACGDPTIYDGKITWK